MFVCVVTMFLCMSLSVVVGCVRRRLCCFERVSVFVVALVERGWSVGVEGERGVVWRAVVSVL